MAVAPLAAAAAPTTTSQTSLPTAVTPMVASPSSEAEQYAARELKDSKVTKFQGGGEVVVIGASAVTILLVLLILVIVF
jgi:hypothetical protein